MPPIATQRKTATKEKEKGTGTMAGSLKDRLSSL
jgi:hypothetical protein